MPTYDYQCRSCGVITEVVHSMLDDGPTKCERCGGELRRLVHPTGIIFKGSGFYKNDSRSSSSGSGESGAGGGAGSTPSSDAGSTTKSSEAGGTEKGSPKASSGGDAAKGSTAKD